VGAYGKTIRIASKLFRELSVDQEILLQAIFMRLNTRRGKLWTDPNYGLLLTDYLQAGVTLADLDRIPFEVRDEVEKDEDRIDSAEVVAKISGAATGAKLLLHFKVSPKTAEPFSFTLAVDEVTVEILSTGKA